MFQGSFMVCIYLLTSILSLPHSINNSLNCIYATTADNINKKKLFTFLAKYLRFDKVNTIYFLSIRKVVHLRSLLLSPLVRFKILL